MAKWKGSHWTIDKIPSRRKTPYRLRWKGLKSLGYPKDENFQRDHYFETVKAAKDFGSSKTDWIQTIGKLAEGLSFERRAEILREAAGLESKGIDPLEAMAEGAGRIEAVGKDGERTIGSFWKDYVERKKGLGKWGTRYQRAQEAFFEETKESFMKLPVKEFVFVGSGHKAIRKLLEDYRRPEKRNAENTIRGAKAKARSFLLFVSMEVEALQRATIIDLFSYTEAIMPEGTREEAENVAISADQAEYLLGYLAERKMAGWAVFKIFAGARTLLLQEWHWSIVNWDDGVVTIPKKHTKLKKSPIRFQFKDIPNFQEWLEWAWEKDGKPKPDQRIAPKSQPTITNYVKKAINANKGLFTDDKRRKIKPGEDMRNFMRSGFITYGLEAMPVGTVMRIAEDRHNLDKYVAWDSGRGSEPEAKRFWKLRPILLENEVISSSKP